MPTNWQQKLTERYHVNWVEELNSDLVKASGFISGQQADVWQKQLQAMYQGPLYSAGSQWSKYYSIYAAIIPIWMFVRENRLVWFEPDELALKPLSPKGFSATYIIKDALPITDRISDREKLWEHLFIEHLTPVFSKVHELCGTSKNVLWGNLSNYLNNYRWQWIHEIDGEAQQAVVDDFQSLFSTAHRLFGDGLYKKPLIHTLDIKLDNNTQKPSFVRKVCCLKYHLTGEAYCSSCPIHNNRLDVALSQKPS